MAHLVGEFWPVHQKVAGLIPDPDQDTYLVPRLEV